MSQNLIDALKNSSTKWIHTESQKNPKMKTPAITNLDVQEFNKQYPSLTVSYTNKVHDRFLIIDHKELYHIGASIKDLGQKCFAFELMEDSLTLIPELLAKLQ